MTTSQGNQSADTLRYWVLEVAFVAVQFGVGLWLYLELVHLLPLPHLAAIFVAAVPGMIWDKYMVKAHVRFLLRGDRSRLLTERAAAAVRHRLQRARDARS